MAETPQWVVSFPTLGDLVTAWVERHCVVPDKHLRGKPFTYSDWQFWCAANHYRVREDLIVDPDRPPLNQAFVNRRSQIIGPQKSGKGPWAATIIAAEAVGPTQVTGWAEEGDLYVCAEWGCPCGWTYAYLPGEPMGGRHPSPLIQLTATSEAQVDNTFGPLRAMVKLGPLQQLMTPRENFIRIHGSAGAPDLDRIDAVTSSADSRLGNPISFALQDETGLYLPTKDGRGGMVRVAETQRRGAAGMGGRTMETTNAPDPAENSVAQRTLESKAEDVFRFYDPPPAHWSYRNKRERRRIHRYNYRHSPWVDIDSIDAEAAELLEKDPAQAERFYGNRLVAASDAYFDDVAWAAIGRPDLAVEDGATIALGFDGSMYDDWTAIRARLILPEPDGQGALHGFTPTFADDRPTVWNPADFGGEVPRAEVQIAVDEIFKRYRVVRMYCDPELWQSEIDAWAAKHGEKVVVQWATNRTRQMAAALERARTDIATSAKAAAEGSPPGLTHDADQTALQHLRNARRVRRPGGIVIGKQSPHQKIDVIMADTLAHEAASDAKAAGETKPRTPSRVLVL